MTMMLADSADADKDEKRQPTTIMTIYVDKDVTRAMRGRAILKMTMTTTMMLTDRTRTKTRTATAGDDEAKIRQDHNDDSVSL